jgi:hypothetical protein
VKLRAGLAGATLAVAAAAALLAGATPEGNACPKTPVGDAVAWDLSIGDACAAAVLGLVALGFGIAQIRRPATRLWNFGAVTATVVALVLDTVGLAYSFDLCLNF